jgi:ubiquinone biosynthesis protein COQ9
MKLMSQMGMFLTKMALQCADFCIYSPSTLVLAALYSSTAFLKHSKSHQGEDTTRFVSEIRRIIFSIMEEEKRQ